MNYNTEEWKQRGFGNLYIFETILVEYPIPQIELWLPTVDHEKFLKSKKCVINFPLAPSDPKGASQCEGLVYSLLHVMEN
jgi:hypothetical protein